jgi:hypothetical protein
MMKRTIIEMEIAEHVHIFLVMSVKIDKLNDLFESI